MSLLSLALVLSLGPAAAGRPVSAQDAGAARGTTAQEIEEAGAEVRLALEASREARERGDLDEARVHVGGALELLQPLAGSRDPVLMPVLVAIDAEAGRLGLLAMQERTRTWVLAIQETRLPADDPEVLGSQQDLGITRYFLHDFQGAHEMFRAVHEARERLLPEDHPFLLAAKSNLALTTRELGDLRGALALQEALLGTYERTRPADDPEVLRTRHSLAMTKQSLGDPLGALELLRPVLAARRRSLPAGHPDLQGAMEVFANLQHELGNDREGLELRRAILEARLAQLPPDHPEVLAAQQNLAVTLRGIGDLEAAHELFLRVHDAFARTLDPDNPTLLMAKTNLAVTTRTFLGDVRAALALEREVYEARARALEPDHPELHKAALNFAGTLLEAGEREAALELFVDVHERRSRILGREHPLTVMSGLMLAIALWADGQRERALERSEQAWGAAQGMQLSDDGLLWAAEILARCRLGLGDREGALALLPVLLDGAQRQVEGALASSPREARAVASTGTRWVMDALALADGVDEYDAALFELVETRRFAASAALARRDAGDSAVTGLQRECAELSGALAALVTAGPGAGEPVDAWRRRIVDLSRRRDAAQGRYFARLREEGGFAGRIAAAELAARLPPDALAVGFLQHEAWSDGVVGGRPAGYLALVLSPDAVCRRIELGPAEEVRARVEAWRAALGAPLERGVAAAPAVDPRAAGSALRELVLDPILAALGEGGEHVATLFVCADEALHLVPFDALPLGDGQRVGDRYRVHPEISFARLLAPQPPSEAPPGLLAVGDVDFDVEPQAGGGRAAPSAAALAGTRASAFGGWRRLLGTKAELDSVGVLFEERFGVAPRLLRREEASKAALFERAPGARYLHVATHGWFAPESILAAGEAAAGDALAPSLERTVQGFAPMTLCGLCLAGANHWRDGRGARGLVTAEELTGLDLSACELAVLSACETNVGVRRAGLGLQSLQAALHLAGARSALTSLWRVDDQLTRELMEAFYTNLWGAGMTKAEALWEAKGALRRAGYPVSAWGGWVLTGDPR